VRDRIEDLAHLSVMLCGLAAVVQTSGLNGAAFRRRTSTQGALRGGLSLLHSLQVCVFRLTRCRCFSQSSPCPRLSACRHAASSSGGMRRVRYFRACGSSACPTRTPKSIQKEGRCATRNAPFPTPSPGAHAGERPALQLAYREAIEDRADALTDDIITLADTPPPPGMDGPGLHAWVAQLKIRVHARECCLLLSVVTRWLCLRRET